MAFLNTILDFINNNLMAASATVAIVIEFVLRMFPSKGPLSIAWVIHDFAAMLAKVLAAIAAFLDKILPQKLA